MLVDPGHVDPKRVCSRNVGSQRVTYMEHLVTIKTERSKSRLE